MPSPYSIITPPLRCAVKSTPVPSALRHYPVSARTSDRSAPPPAPLAWVQASLRATAAMPSHLQPPAQAASPLTAPPLLHLSGLPFRATSPRAAPPPRTCAHRTLRPSPHHAPSSDIDGTAPILLSPRSLTTSQPAPAIPLPCDSGLTLWHPQAPIPPIFCVNQPRQNCSGHFASPNHFLPKTPEYKASFDGPFFTPFFSDPQATLNSLSTVMDNCPNPPQTTSLPEAI